MRGKPSLASDLLLGFILGVVLVGVASPIKGILFTMLEQKKIIDQLQNPEPNQNVPDETLAEKRP